MTMMSFPTFMPQGYSGNLTETQKDAVVGLREILEGFAKDQEQATDCSCEKMEEAPAEVEPTAPLQPGTAKEEAAEARELASSEPDMLRFLRARSFDVSQASAMAIGNCKWRASVKPKSITPEMIPNALSSGLLRFAGYSTNGMPVIVAQASLWKPSEYYGVDEYARYCAYFFDLAISRMGPGVERMLVITVLEGFSAEMMRPFASRCIARSMDILCSHYPERLGIAVAINVPWIFKTFYENVVRHWIDPSTSAKIHFPEGDPSDTLLQFIHKDILQADLGGTHALYPSQSKSAPDELEAFLAEIGGQDQLPVGVDAGAITGVTERSVIKTIISGSSEWTRNEEIKMHEEKALSGEALVPAGQVFKLEIELESSTKQVQWDFHTLAHDIGFGYKFVTRSLQGHCRHSEELSPSVHVISQRTGQALHLPATIGIERCTSLTDGLKFTTMQDAAAPQDELCNGAKLTLVFDNTYSRFRSKTVSYTVTVNAA